LKHQTVDDALGLTMDVFEPVSLREYDTVHTLISAWKMLVSGACLHIPHIDIIHARTHMESMTILITK